MVLLIGGPAGVGKSTVAQRVAARLGWQCVGEDEYWVRNGWGSGRRSIEQEHAVQRQVLADLMPVVHGGRSAVLEFILYKPPPNPMTAYQEALQANAVGVTTIVLEASVDDLLRRMHTRGRPGDLADMVTRRRNAEHQVRVLASVDQRCLIDSTDLSLDETVAAVLRRLGRRV